MTLRFQGVTLVDSPTYPNSIAWSDENLIAVASGHIVTILNPALPSGPRGLINVPKSEPYHIGLVKREELLSSCLLSIALSRETRPCVRSISWSNLGLAPNSGCLLAVCTTEGHVKLYRPPFCDYGAEWIEVLDITDRLYDYLASINFEEPDFPSSEISKELVTDHGCIDDPPDSVLGKAHKRRRVNTSGVRNFGSETFLDDISCHKNGKDLELMPTPDIICQRMNSKRGFFMGEKSHLIVPALKSKRKSSKKIPESCSQPLITTYQYASRSAMLSSLVVAWSPLLKLSSEIGVLPKSTASNMCSLLAVGAKSGKLSCWRIHAPPYYSIEQNVAPAAVEFIGILQAHKSWVTTISWALLDSGSSNPRVLLATGSSDGSVRIWIGHGEELLMSSQVNNAPFDLFEEIVKIDAIPVSVLSLMPTQSLHKMLLAVGKGSGAFEVWTGDISKKKFIKAGSYNAHDQVVTGLTWAFNGCFLYSCSQDNFVRSWCLHGSSLAEVPIPSSSPGIRSFSDLPDVSISCLGLAVSPGDLAIAMVRSFDVNQLDRMYEARLQKAAVEFFWIGGQEKDILSNTSIGFDIEAFPKFSEKELVHWKLNIMWSLKQFEYWNKPLVVWDIVAALLAFKQSVPDLVNQVLLKWLSLSFLDLPMEHSIEKVIPHVCKSFANAASRQLHLLNIICRRVMLSELKADEINSILLKSQGLDYANFAGDKQLNLWMELLLSSERELRERLVGFSFSAYKNFAYNSATYSSDSGCWYPVGLAQMKQWVERNHCHVRQQLKVLASEIKSHKRSNSIGLNANEQCGYCSAPVPFDSPEFAFCKGLGTKDGSGQGHKLPRCAVSMQVCPLTPLWLCKCCQRWSFNLAPDSPFKMVQYPQDFNLSTIGKEATKPLCPFCGILLQRLQPEFLLSAQPV